MSELLQSILELPLLGKSIGNLSPREEQGEISLNLARQDRIVVEVSFRHQQPIHFDCRVSEPVHFDGRANRVVHHVSSQDAFLQCSRCFTEPWGAGCSAALIPASKYLEEANDALLTRQMFCEEVCGVQLAPDLPQLKRPVSDTLLDPETPCVDVAQLAQALAAANAHRRT